MRGKLIAATWRFAVFAVVCVLGIFGLFAIFAQLRFEHENVYRAVFSNVSGLKNNDFVRIAGVEVGKVKKVAMQKDSTLIVEFGADPSVMLTDATRAVIRWDNLIGDRYLALEEGTGEGKRLAPGAMIPLARTAPALDLDALVGGFRPLFRALNPDQVNALSGQLIAALQGKGATISSFLEQTAAATDNLANRDALIGQVITNLNIVLGSLGDQSQQFDKAVTSVSDLVAELAARKTDISIGLGYSNAAAGTTADLLSQVRPPFKELMAQGDRASTSVLADHEYFDHILNTLPDKYKLLGRQGLYGDYFSFFVCDVILKVNGKNGQPVFVKVVGQDTGRCSPK